MGSELSLLEKCTDIFVAWTLVYFDCANFLTIVVQYLGGRQTTAIPRVASAAEFIEPTQGFDSHVSVIPPLRSDSLQNQYDRSQVFPPYFVKFLVCFFNFKFCLFVF